jgi:hypothetical protein
MIGNDKNLESAQHFSLHLARTILWCAPHVDTANPKDCLRTLELRPRVFERDRFSAVDFVVSQRRLKGGVKFRDA